MTIQYSTVQKLSLAGMVIGSLMCLVGTATPYWIVSDPQGFSGTVSFLSKVFKGYMGLFMYCIEVPLAGRKCGSTGFSLDFEVLGIDTDSEGRDTGSEFPGNTDSESDSASGKGWLHASQVGAVSCVMLGGLCGLIALCLACCTCCKRFVVVGILAFLAAAAGSFSAISFANNMEGFTATIVGFKIASFGWSFYLFCAGTGVLGLCSFTACFASPENPMRNMIMGGGSGGPTVITTSMQSQQNMPYYNLRESPAHTVNPVAAADPYPAGPGGIPTCANPYPDPPHAGY